MASHERGRTVAGLVVALSLVAVALLALGQRAEPVAASSAAAIHEARVTGVLPAVVREVASRASLPDIAPVSGTAVVTALAVLLGLVAWAAPRAVRPVAATGLARRRAPPRV